MAITPIDVSEMAKKLCCKVASDGDIYFDLTPYIVVPSFNVQLRPEYYEWEDMRHEVHRRLKRMTISGGFKLLIEDPDVLSEFIEYFYDAPSQPLFVVPSNISNIGFYAIEDYIYSNLNYAFNDFAVSYSIPSIVPYLGRKKVDPIDVSISNKVQQITDWNIVFPGPTQDDNPILIGE